MSNIVRFDSKDKDIAAVKCYMNENMTGLLYRDIEKCDPLSFAEALDLMIKGLLVVVQFAGNDIVVCARPVAVAKSGEDDYDYQVFFFNADVEENPDEDGE